MNRTNILIGCNYRPVPRVRGDEPTAVDAAAGGGVCSPRARG